MNVVLRYTAATMTILLHTSGCRSNRSSCFHVKGPFFFNACNSRSSSPGFSFLFFFQLCCQCAMRQYEREHLVCALRAVLSNAHAKTSLEDVCYIVLALRNLTFFFQRKNNKNYRFHMQAGRCLLYWRPLKMSRAHHFSCKRND